MNFANMAGNPKSLTLSTVAHAGNPCILDGYTPGPWTAYPTQYGDWRVKAPNGATITDPFSTENTEADARLIAAAPELVAALKDCVDALQTVVDQHQRSVAYGVVSCDALTAARAALSKAGVV